MAIQIQLRQGTTTEHDTFTGAVGEVTVDITTKTLRVHDGSTVGGTPLVTYADIINYLPLAYPRDTPPVGYLVMLGQSISQSTYPSLYSLYGATLPDLRGQFLRGLDYGKGIDAGRTVRSFQEDMLKSHNHVISPANTVHGSGQGFQGSGFQLINNKTTEYTGGTETRPKNIAFLYIVKAG